MLSRAFAIFLVLLTAVTTPTPIIPNIFSSETENAPLPIEQEEEKQVKLHRKKKLLTIPKLDARLVKTLISRYGSPPLSVVLSSPQNIYKNLPLPPLRLLI
jgi:hypothetical protein